ncbi:MAG: hypothetical protein MUC43_06000 [Pirellula sp.]|jgi:hypothetical protein|nr:hypothetical protein [Pirellula sp.]
MHFATTHRLSISLVCSLAVLLSAGKIKAETNDRMVVRLSDWLLSDQPNREVSTQTGDSWEKVLGDDFNGTATYRTKLPEIETKGRRILLHFEAVATRAVVKVNGKLLGEHLGGWTPFRVDITDDYQPDALVEVVVDELPGHNTQGFLPVFIPHFGGIWGKVELLLVPDTAYIDDLSLFAAAWETDQTRIELSVQRSVGFTSPLSIGIRAKRSEQWTWNPLSDTEQSVALKQDESITKEWPIWSPENPTGTDCEFVLRDDSTGVILDRQERRVYRRTVKAIGRDIYLNNKPISIRGVLNWGYAPPRLCPSRDPEWMRSELEFIKARGFNTMKFCLWIPPREYLELCDEMGILAWIEYPTWHPKLTQEFFPQLMKEYEEFFLYDRNHPSVILRSLTCETGHSAELQVIKSIYDKAHELIPGSLVEDDSSWISWQRVHDFYDDHPYGNNHKWRGVLQGLDDFIKQREPKPLVLGEAIAADTWTDANTNMPDAPHSLLSHPKSSAAEQQIKAWMGDDCNWRMASFLHAMETRKFQIERFRHQLPRQGYNVSVIRDFPFASMGLIDFENKPKTTVEQWSWHGEQMICLETPEDCRSFFNGIETELMFHLLEPGVGANQIEWNVNGEEQPTINVMSHDTNQSRLTVKASWQPRSKSLVPTPVSLVVKWLNNNRLIATNQWTLWIVPSLNELKSPPRLLRHESVDPKKLIDCPLFRNAGVWSPGSSDDKAIVIASAFDNALWKWLNAGGKVLMLPDGRAGSFPIAEHWFLRGGPIVNRNSFIDSNAAEMMESLQAFDLAGPVMPNLSIIDEVEPWILLWDNHDIREYRFHACSWGANVGQGQLLVSTLETDASRGAATQHFLSHALERLAKGRFAKSLKEETLSRMEQDLKSELMEVPRNDWSFKADPKKQGVDGGWHSLAADASWGKIRIGEHWDGQGYQGLDGWAWYTKELTIPNGANYMIFTGVDDYFEVFVDGQKCGTGGDLKNRKTAFDMVIPIPIPADKRGNVRVSILVDDWQGAGGIFRKVFFSSELPSPKPAILQRKTIQQTP